MLHIAFVVIQKWHKLSLSYISFNVRGSAGAINRDLCDLSLSHLANAHNPLSNC